MEFYANLFLSVPMGSRGAPSIRFLVDQQTLKLTDTLLCHGNVDFMPKTAGYD